MAIMHIGIKITTHQIMFVKLNVFNWIWKYKGIVIESWPSKNNRKLKKSLSKLKFIYKLGSLTNKN